MKLETMVLGPLETNCYLLWDEQTMEAAVIDPGASGQKIADRLAQNGLMLRMILLTHAHFDHIGGLQQLHELTGAPVWVSKIDSTDPAEMTHGRLIFTNTYEDGDELTLGHIKIHVIATPGHTPGGACFLCGDSLFTGDTLFLESVGRTDFPGGSGAALRASVRKLLSLEGDKTVYPGHDDPTTLSHERKYNPFAQ